MTLAEQLRTGFFPRNETKVEAIKTKAAKRDSLFEYKPFAGNLGSSPENWVPADFLVSKLADVFHVSDQDLKKKE